MQNFDATETFTGPAGARFTQGLFRFPGSFHPPVLSRIMGDNPGATSVGDAMAGCGTTALFAVAKGMDAVVSDVDPVACLLTRAKCNPVEPEELRLRVAKWIQLTGEMGYRANPGVTPTEAIEEMELATRFRAPANVFHWFHPTIARDIARLLLTFSKFDSPTGSAERDALLAILAATIRRVSRADPKPVSGVEVTSIRRKQLAAGLRFGLAEELTGRAEILARGYGELLELPELGRTLVAEGNASRWYEICEKLGRFPMIQITSPPYSGAIDYARRHRLENCWLGFVNRDRYRDFARSFIGARAIRHRESWSDFVPTSPTAKACLADVSTNGGLRASRWLAQYLMDLSCWLSQTCKVALESDNGGVYVVVGPNRVAGVMVDTPRLVSELAAGAGLSLASRFTYTIRNRRMNYPLWNGATIRTETVLKFEPTIGVRTAS